jgi:hypothetical protein
MKHVFFPTSVSAHASRTGSSLNAHSVPSSEANMSAQWKRDETCRFPRPLLLVAIEGS